MMQQLEVRTVAPKPTNRDYLIAVAAVAASAVVVNTVVRLVYRRLPVSLSSPVQEVIGWGIGGIAGLAVLYAASQL